MREWRIRMEAEGREGRGHEEREKKTNGKGGKGRGKREGRRTIEKWREEGGEGKRKIEEESVDKNEQEREDEK